MGSHERGPQNSHSPLLTVIQQCTFLKSPFPTYIILLNLIILEFKNHKSLVTTRQEFLSFKGLPQSRDRQVQLVSICIVNHHV